MSPTRIGVIGAGRVGAVLAAALREAATLRVASGWRDPAFLQAARSLIGSLVVRPRRYLEQIAKVLPAGGRLLIKDVESKPAWKRWFTHALDLAMDPRSPVHYWSGESLQALLEDVGFEVYRHLMVDVLPYPHVLYVCHRTA